MALQKTQPLLSFPVSTGSYAVMLREMIALAQSGESAYVCVANVHMMVTAHQEKDFAEVVKGADIVTPDGLPLTWAMRLLFGIRQERVAGMDLLPDLVHEACIHRIPVYFYGGTDAMLGTARDYLQKHYPELIVAGMYSPPFRPLSVEESDEIAATINRSGAKLVLVVLGCPKQEKWMCAMKPKLKAVSIGIGGALPVFTQQQKRAPGWMQKSGLEWLYRLGQEPRRLFRRYAVTNSVFIWLLAKAWLRKKMTGTVPGTN